MSFRTLFSAALVASSIAGPVSGAEFLVYFGTFTGNGKSEGIYVSRFSTDTGVLSKPELAARTRNPDFIALHPNLRVLYAVGERKNRAGSWEGTIEAFGIDSSSGILRPLNHGSTEAGPLCYIQIDATGRTALGAAYNDGYVVSLSLNDDGTVHRRVSLIRHAGSSVHPRQEKPHAHCIDLDRTNTYALTADLGLDRVVAYRFDPSKSTLTPQPQPFTTKPGAGPRHLAFSADGRHVYLINELDNTLVVCDYDRSNGRLSGKQTLPLLPDDFAGASTAAEVALHPSGRFLYATNRGHDSIAAYTVATDTGLLTFAGYQRDGIRHPRHFAIAPGGNWLLCANRDANSITIHQIDPNTGRLSARTGEIEVPSPACVLFAQGR